MTPQDIAEQNFQSRVAANPYPGRGLIIGLAGDGETWVQVYWIMGRSEHSRNRKFVLDGTTMTTEPVDVSKLEDPSLIIYEAILELPYLFMVSNGDQTRTLCEGLKEGMTIKHALASRDREHDAPNYTPRITGLLNLKGKAPAIALSILKANKIDPEFTDRHYFYPQVPTAGLGYGLTTYEGDGSPLPSFSGDPLLMPLKGGAQDILDRYWSGLDEDNKISIAVKTIAADGSKSDVIVRNKHS
ncbi:MAG: IMP cyclohydrolase [Verrucomicrobiota bacterium]